MSLVRHLSLVAVLTLAVPALHAAPEQDASEVLYKLGTSDNDGTDAARPRFVFAAHALVAPKLQAAMGGFDDSGGFDGKIIGELGVAAWVGADYEYGQICGADGCGAGGPTATAHALGLFEKVGDHWHAVTWQIARTVTPAEQAKALAAHVRPDAFARAVEPAAKTAVAQLEAGLKSGAALAKTVADRDDVVLFGAAPGPRVVGAAKVRAALAHWPALRVTDGLQAGTIGGGTVAWIAANVAATSGKHEPYRLLAVYIKDHASWRLVALQLAFVTASPR